MRPLLSTYESPRWNAELLLELVERSLILGVDARLCVPPDLSDRLAQIGGGR